LPKQGKGDAQKTRVGARHQEGNAPKRRVSFGRHAEDYGGEEEKGKKKGYVGNPNRRKCGGRNQDVILALKERGKVNGTTQRSLERAK